MEQTDLLLKRRFLFIFYCCQYKMRSEDNVYFLAALVTEEEKKGRTARDVFRFILLKTKLHSEIQSILQTTRKREEIWIDDSFMCQI